MCIRSTLRHSNDSGSTAQNDDTPPFSRATRRCEWSHQSFLFFHGLDLLFDKEEDTIDVDSLNLKPFLDGGVSKVFAFPTKGLCKVNNSG